MKTITFLSTVFFFILNGLTAAQEAEGKTDENTPDQYAIHTNSAWSIPHFADAWPVAYLVHVTQDSVARAFVTKINNTEPKEDEDFPFTLDEQFAETYKWTICPEELIFPGLKMTISDNNRIFEALAVDGEDPKKIFLTVLVKRDGTTITKEDIKNLNGGREIVLDYTEISTRPVEDQEEPEYGYDYSEPTYDYDYSSPSLDYLREQSESLKEITKNTGGIRHGLWIIGGALVVLVIIQCLQKKF